MNTPLPNPAPGASRHRRNLLPGAGLFLLVATFLAGVGFLGLAVLLGRREGKP